MQSVGGGDVAMSYRVELGDGRTVFAKTHPSAPPGFFTTEATGLRWMDETATIPVPKVLAVCDAAPNYLVLEWISTGSPGPRTEGDLGHSLAGLHQSGAPCFGREDRRTTGSRGLPNEPSETWVDFYATQRLLPLARLARDQDALPTDAITSLERVAARLSEIGGPAEPPARLHGDLWAGNRMIDDRGISWVIDPACHGGHREFDLAMMRLFGGFGPDVFAAYQESTPLADGWPERVSLHQIAPLAVHAIKFGGSYVSTAARAIETYC